MIHAERDSVCMGDDVYAPNAEEFPFGGGSITELLKAVSGYVPKMKFAVWVVCRSISSKEALGALYLDENGEYAYLPLAKNLPQIREIYVRYFANYDHSLPNAEFAKTCLKEKGYCIS